MLAQAMLTFCASSWNLPENNESLANGIYLLVFFLNPYGKLMPSHGWHSSLLSPIFWCFLLRMKTTSVLNLLMEKIVLATANISFTWHRCGETSAALVLWHWEMFCGQYVTLDSMPCRPNPERKPFANAWTRGGCSFSSFFPQKPELSRSLFGSILIRRSWTHTYGSPNCN